MAAYMKTTMPFYGIRVPARRFIIRQAIKQYPIKNQEEYRAVINALWNKPHREEKYAAIDVARAYPEYIDLISLPLYEQMIRQGAWWDFVDDIALHLIGFLLNNHQLTMWPILETWLRDNNLWIRRTVIICQNRLKIKTDSKYLFDFCLYHAKEKNFFIRKAIGWALREYAKSEPAKVIEFLVKNKDQFSNLSYKEAVKKINKKF